MDENAKQGSLSIRIGLGWAKSLSFFTGQCPVMKYHRYRYGCHWLRCCLTFLSHPRAGNCWRSSWRASARSQRRSTCSSSASTRHRRATRTSTKVRRWEYLRHGSTFVDFRFTRSHLVATGAAKKFVIDPHGIVRAHWAKKAQK